MCRNARAMLGDARESFMKRIAVVTLAVCAVIAQTPPVASLLAQAPAPPGRRGRGAGDAGGQRANAGRGSDNIPSVAPNLPPGTCLPGIDVRAPLVGAQSIRNLFDASVPPAGAPYIEATFADGSIRRWRADNRVEVQRPGQATVTCVPGYALVNAPAPTMPDLPPDPRAKTWLDYQNSALQTLINTLVNNDASVLQNISDGERKSAGTNVYSQIVFRTRIASFYASKRQ
jgi:hypothetical protein